MDSGARAVSSAALTFDKAPGIAGERRAAPRPAVVPLRFDLPVGRLTSGLALIVLTLTALSLAGQYTKYYLGHDQLLGLIRQFNVSHEGNIPTWYSSLSLLFCAALLAIIGYDRRLAGDRFRRHWIGLACLFFYVSLDEGTAIHEMLNAPLAAAFHTHGLLYYPAAGVGLVFALFLAVVYFRFFWSLPARTRLLFVAAAVVYLGGALGVEMLSARHAEVFGQQNMTYAVITTVEEFGEMMGVVIFVYALLTYMCEHTPPLVVRACRASSA